MYSFALVCCQSDCIVQITFCLRLGLWSNLRTKKEFLSMTEDKTKVLLSFENLCKIDQRANVHMRIKSDLFI